MTQERRSVYEYGDTLEEALARQTRREHDHAAARGQTLLGHADACVDQLVGRGLLTEPDVARRELFHVLADRLYGCASIDIPDFTSRESLERLRRRG